MNFREFALRETRDIFGFDHQKPSKAPPELPIDPIDSDMVLDELERLPVGNKRPHRDWHDAVEWGHDEYGSIKAEVSPLGSYKMIIRRAIKDLQGETVWVCKRIHNFNETGHDRNEMTLAYQLYDEIKQVNEEVPESPSTQYDNFEKLAKSLITTVQLKAPEIFVFENAIKLDPNNYLIYCSYRGHGVEAPGGNRAEQFNINVQFDSRRGLVRCWGCEVTSPTKGHQWELQPSDWDEYFSPAQPITEIVQAILNALLTY